MRGLVKSMPVYCGMDLNVGKTVLFDH